MGIACYADLGFSVQTIFLHLHGTGHHHLGDVSAKFSVFSRVRMLNKGIIGLK